MRTQISSGLRLAVIGLAATAISATNLIALDASKTPTAPGSPAPTAANPSVQVPLSSGVADVLKLVQSKVGNETVIAFVNNSSTAYNPSASEILYLRDHGVSDQVIMAMLYHRVTASDTPAPTPTSPAYTAPTETAPAWQQEAPPATAPAASVWSAPAEPSTAHASTPPTSVQTQPATTYVVTSPTVVQAQPSTVYVAPPAPAYPYAYPASYPYAGAYSPWSLSVGFGYGGVYGAIGYGGVYGYGGYYGHGGYYNHGCYYGGGYHGYHH